ncbi:MAG: glycoside hydrolase, partial [bacterium]
TGTVFENYAPERPAPGRPAKRDFVGWGGVGPVAVLLEYVFGLRPDVPRGELLWDVRLREEHGVHRYPFGRSGSLDLVCHARASLREAPRIEARSSVPLTLRVIWAGGSRRLRLAASRRATAP